MKVYSTLEAMLLEKPVLVNGKCDVLVGHCRSGNDGLWYTNYEEFETCLELLLGSTDMRAAMGKAGNAYVTGRYRWDTVVKNYLSLFEKLTF